VRPVTGNHAVVGPIHWLYDVADPVRLAILRSLSEVEEATIADLAYRAQTSTPTLRRHLEAFMVAGHVQSGRLTPSRRPTSCARRLFGISPPLSGDLG
jgi:DNA-binding transcriptional ArsR family regulator